MEEIRQYEHLLGSKLGTVHSVSYSEYRLRAYLLKVCEHHNALFWLKSMQHSEVSWVQTCFEIIRSTIPGCFLDAFDRVDHVLSFKKLLHRWHFLLHWQLLLEWFSLTQVSHLCYVGWHSLSNIVYDLYR